MLKAALLVAAVGMVFKVARREEGSVFEKLTYVGRALFGSRNVKFLHRPTHHFGHAFA